MKLFLIGDRIFKKKIMSSSNLSYAYQSFKKLIVFKKKLFLF